MVFRRLIKLNISRTVTSNVLLIRSWCYYFVKLLSQFNFLKHKIQFLISSRLFQSWSSIQSSNHRDSSTLGQEMG